MLAGRDGTGTMESYDPERGEAVEQALRALVRDWDDVTREVLFGYPSYRAGGTVFAVVANDGLVLTRLPDAERARLAAVRETGPFQAGSQTIESWVHVPVGADHLADLRPSVRASHETAVGESRTVPPPHEK